LLTNKDIEKLYVFVNGYHDLCPSGNKISFVGYAVGYRLCGPANVCQCTRDAVATGISITKSCYDQSTKNNIKSKRQATNLDRYGIDNVFKDVDKIKQSMIDKYGVENANKLPEIRQKIAKTNIDRYGGVSPMASPDVKDKMISTNNERYGTDYALQSIDIQKKIQKTMIDNYGAISPIHNQDIKNKIKETNIERYGVDNPAQHIDVKLKIRESSRTTFLDNLTERLKPHGIMPLGIFDKVENHQSWLCENCSTQITGKAHNGKIPRCYTCFPESISGPQQSIANFLIELVGHDAVVQNDRKLLEDVTDRRRSKEVDILLRDYKIGIEYCGLRWHTEFSGGRGRNSHYDKTYLCQNLGIQLITIYSDEWVEKSTLLKSMIRVRLGLGAKYHARKLSTGIVTYITAKLFFETNHIQGHVNSSDYFGLFDGDKLIMCLSTSVPRYNKQYSLEITRLASVQNTIVVGGASKLFKYMLSIKNPKSVISYCDLRYGTGAVYTHLGFVKTGNPTIGYEYVEVNCANIRYNRLHYQKHKLGNTNNLSERDYLASIGFERVYDCGHQKYIWTSDIDNNSTRIK